MKILFSSLCAWLLIKALLHCQAASILPGNGVNNASDKKDTGSNIGVIGNTISTANATLKYLRILIIKKILTQLVGNGNSPDKQSIAYQILGPGLLSDLIRAIFGQNGALDGPADTLSEDVFGHDANKNVLSAIGANNNGLIDASGDPTLRELAGYNYRKGN